MKLLVTFFLIILTATFVFSQDEWIRVQSDNGEFSIEVPKNFSYFFDKDGFDYSVNSQSFVFSQMQMLNASFEKTVISVEVYKVPSPKSYRNRLLEGQRFNNSTKRDFKQLDFDIREYEQKKFKTDKSELEISHITRFITSKTHLYIVTVANHGAKSSSFEKCLASIKLGSNQNNLSTAEKVVNISSKKPITINDIFADATINPIPKPTIIPNSSKHDDDSTPFLILTKPFASYTQQARDNRTSGKLRTRITFEKNGAISKIEFLEGLPDGLNRNGFFAALRIKFIPNEKDGELQTVKKQVEYSFSIG